MPRIIITDDRHSHKVGIGHNGKLTEVPVNEPVDVDAGVVDALTNSSIAFSLVEDGGGSAGVAKPPPARRRRKPRAKRTK